MGAPSRPPVRPWPTWSQPPVPHRMPAGPNDRRSAPLTAPLRRVALAVGLALLAACGPDPAEREAAPSPPGPDAFLTPVAALDLGDGGDAHALSGLWVDPDGSRIVAVSDRGHRYVAALERADDGRITTVRGLDFGAMGGVGDKRDRTSRDAEALAALPDGRWVVAFERDHRLARYGPGADGLDGPAERMDGPEGLDRLPRNSGIEALARLPDGVLLAIAEAKTGPGLSHPAWIGGPGGWQPFFVAAEPGWAPVDAAALPDGGVLVLERWYLPILGFRSRLSVLPAAAIARARAGAGGAAGVVVPVRLAPVAPDIGRDNYEGLAIRPLEDGRLELLIVSDDNVPNPAQRPILLQYRLDPMALEAVLGAPAG